MSVSDRRDGRAATDSENVSTIRCRVGHTASMYPCSSQVRERPAAPTANIAYAKLTMSSVIRSRSSLL
jgi:hypothetical protein